MWNIANKYPLHYVYLTKCEHYFSCHIKFSRKLFIGNLSLVLVPSAHTRDYLALLVVFLSNTDIKIIHFPQPSASLVSFAKVILTYDFPIWKGQVIIFFRCLKKNICFYLRFQKSSANVFFTDIKYSSVHKVPLDISLLKFLRSWEPERCWNC